MWPRLRVPRLRSLATQLTCIRGRAQAPERTFGKVVNQLAQPVAEPAPERDSRGGEDEVGVGCAAAHHRVVGVQVGLHQGLHVPAQVHKQLVALLVLAHCRPAVVLHQLLQNAAAGGREPSHALKDCTSAAKDVRDQNLTCLSVKNKLLSKLFCSHLTDQDLTAAVATFPSHLRVWGKTDGQ